MLSLRFVHRLSLALTLSAALMSVFGAAIAGAGSSLAAIAAQSPWLPAHRVAGAVVAALSLALSLSAAFSETGKWLKQLAHLVFLSVVALAVWAAAAPVSQPSALAHAILAHIVFICMVLLTVATSPSWRRERTLFEDRGSPSLRTLAWIAPPVVLLQAAFGAAYRYEALSFLPHAGWAFAALLLLLMLGAFVLMAPAPVWLRREAIVLLSLLGLQLLLGVGALVVRMTPSEPIAADWLILAVRVAHVTTGTLILGFTVALSAGILRCAVVPSATMASNLAGSGQRG